MIVVIVNILIIRHDNILVELSSIQQTTIMFKIISIIIVPSNNNLAKPKTATQKKILTLHNKVANTKPLKTI